MFAGLYETWMVAWETALTTRDENRVERPLEWGFGHLADCGGLHAAREVARQEYFPLDAMKALNHRIVADPESFFAYKTPTDFNIEQRFPELHPTNVRPETLEQEREWQRRAETGELRREPFLRWSSAVKTGVAENDYANARWYPTPPGKGFVDQRTGRRRRQAIIVMPQWNADAFSHNALCEMFNRWGIACLRLSKPYHDVRRPAELERSDYAVSSNIGRTIAAARQAVVDVRSAIDWLETQGYEQFGVLGKQVRFVWARRGIIRAPQAETSNSHRNLLLHFRIFRTAFPPAVPAQVLNGFDFPAGSGPGLPFRGPRHFSIQKLLQWPRTAPGSRAVFPKRRTRPAGGIPLRHRDLRRRSKQLSAASDSGCG